MFNTLCITILPSAGPWKEICFFSSYSYILINIFKFCPNFIIHLITWSLIIEVFITNILIFSIYQLITSTNIREGSCTFMCLLQSCIVAVVVPDVDVVKSWACENGIPGTLSVLCAHPEVKQLIMDDMVSWGKEAGLKSFEQVCG
jgi:hypothetical protein